MHVTYFARESRREVGRVSRVREQKSCSVSLPDCHRPRCPIGWPSTTIRGMSRNDTITGADSRPGFVGNTPTCVHRHHLALNRHAASSGRHSEPLNVGLRHALEDQRNWFWHRPKQHRRPWRLSGVRAKATPEPSLSRSSAGVCDVARLQREAVFAKVTQTKEQLSCSSSSSLSSSSLSCCLGLHRSTMPTDMITFAIVN